MEAAPAMDGGVDRLRLDNPAPEPIGPQVRRPRIINDDDSTTDDEDEPPRQVPRVRGWSEIVAELPPLRQNTAKARFVEEFPDPQEYPAWVPKEFVSDDLVPTTYESAWAELCTATEQRDALATKLQKAEAKLASAEAALQRNASAANQGKRDRAAAAKTTAEADHQQLDLRVRDLAREAEWERANLEAEALAYHKHPYELLAKKFRHKREAQDDYLVQPAQLPPLSDPRNLGVAVYKIFEDNDERKQWVESMKHAVDNTPEFVDHFFREGERAGQKRSLMNLLHLNIAAGGFAALNHPSSFHNQFVRSLRMRVHGEVVFRDLLGMTNNGANSGSTHLEQIVDRMMVRRSFQTPTAEAWHRDVAVGTRPGDRVFGGWINLNSYDQHFSCVLGSAHERRDPNDPVGFATIPEAQHPEIVVRSSKVVIPPGHMIVFNEDTIHEVANNQNSTTLLRLFTGWRLSRWEPLGQPPEPLIVDLDRRLRDQEGMPLKSGQHKHYKSDDYFDDNVPEARKYHESNNPSGFRYYPGPPPFYPSAYWGQQDPDTVTKFCEILKPFIVHKRFFNPATSQRRSAQVPNGVKCNLDIYHPPSGDVYNENDTQPVKPDTIRSLKEIKEWLDTQPHINEAVQWMQEEYTPEEVAILKPHVIHVFRQMLSTPACMARASPLNRANQELEPDLHGDPNVPAAILVPPPELGLPMF
mgnify:CR=1 FL=1